MTSPPATISAPAKGPLVTIASAAALLFVEAAAPPDLPADADDRLVAAACAKLL